MIVRLTASHRMLAKDTCFVAADVDGPGAGFRLTFPPYSAGVVPMKAK